MMLKTIHSYDVILYMKTYLLNDTQNFGAFWISDVGTDTLSWLGSGAAIAFDSPM